jgi:CheY-like chemotaxis protein
MDANRRGGTGGEQEVGSVAVGNGLQQAHHTFIHAAGQCTVGGVPSGQVLVVSADERWLRVLEVTLRLGGVDTISRRSAREALSLADGEAGVSALVLDLAQATGDELDVVRGLLGQSSLPAVVILPERLASHSEPFAGAGATVLVRPYRPSELYAALRITDTEDVLPDEAIPPAAAAEPVAAAQTDTPVDTDEA